YEEVGRALVDAAARRDRPGLRLSADGPGAVAQPMYHVRDVIAGEIDRAAIGRERIACRRGPRRAAASHGVRPAGIAGAEVPVRRLAERHEAGIPVRRVRAAVAGETRHDRENVAVRGLHALIGSVDRGLPESDVPG